MKQLFSSRASFRSRLLTIVSLGIVGLALTASITTAWVTSRRAAAQIVAQGLQITANLAEQGVLALLYESRENGEKPLQTIMSFPDVTRAALFDSGRSPLLSVGEKGVPLPENLPLSPRMPELVDETATSWTFAAPVRYGVQEGEVVNPDDQFQLTTAQGELLGFALVIMDKGTLRSMQYDIFINNIGIALSFALVLVFLVNLGIERLIRPLYQLVALMKEAEQEGVHVYAELKGPLEITHMAGVFNRMMASLQEQDRRLRQHGEILQSEVEMRTQELIQARDAALSASRHKSEFLSNMSHELRTPLQAIIGYSDVVKEDLELAGMEENVRELDMVIANAQRLLTLINNILDLAKIEAGRMDLHLQEVDLEELIAEAADTIMPILRRNGNHIHIEVRNQGRILDIDREKLRQIALNLLSNACKFTRTGTVRLWAEQTEHLLTLRVSDTGIGLSEEQQKVIFEEFRQVDGSTTRSFEGTGLGLSITKRFCELMGGEIDVESTVGEGASFTVRIPLPIQATRQTHPPCREKQRLEAPPLFIAPLPPGGEETILLVNDDTTFVDLQVRALRQAGYRVFTAAKGSEALRLARALQPTVITLDIMMPAMDGWEVLERLKGDPDLQKIPVIICSIIDEKFQRLSPGAGEYTAKAIERAKLLMATERICKDPEAAVSVSVSGRGGE